MLSLEVIEIEDLQMNFVLLTVQDVHGEIQSLRVERDRHKP